jgi:hypothetical protein
MWILEVTQETGIEKDKKRGMSALYYGFGSLLRTRREDLRPHSLVNVAEGVRGVITSFAFLALTQWILGKSLTHYKHQGQEMNTYTLAPRVSGWCDWPESNRHARYSRSNGF